MFSFSMPELLLILIIALVVFGPSKLPEVGKALGKSLQEFKKATSNDKINNDGEEKDGDVVVKIENTVVDSKEEKNKKDVK